MNNVKKAFCYIALGFLLGALLVWRIFGRRIDGGSSELGTSADGIADNIGESCESSSSAEQHLGGAISDSNSAEQHIDGAIEHSGSADQHLDEAQSSIGRADTALTDAIERLRNYIRNEAT